MPDATLNSLSISLALPTSVGTAVACPPLSRIDETVASRAAAPLAATTTWARSRAIASAVARPIPRLAPVTTATRPASQCVPSAMRCRESRREDFAVCALVAVQHCLDVEVRLRVSAAAGAVEFGSAAERRCRPITISGSDKEARDSVDDDVLEPAAPIRDHRGGARLRFSRNPARARPSRPGRARPRRRQ